MDMMAARAPLATCSSLMMLRQLSIPKGRSISGTQASLPLWRRPSGLRRGDKWQFVIQSRNSVPLARVQALSGRCDYSQDTRHKGSSTSINRKTLRENIYTLPNVLTFSRLIAAPVIGYLVLHDYHASALGLFVYAGVTDLVDGYIARRWRSQTVIGTIIDPLADKTLMTILTVTLAMQGSLPVWLAVIILGRDIALGIAAIYYRWISLPPPKTFRRYWDFTLPSAEVHPTTISKYNTAFQLALLGATTALPLVAIDLGLALSYMQYLVASTTVLSGLSYVFSRDAVKILNKKG